MFKIIRINYKWVFIISVHIVYYLLMIKSRVFCFRMNSMWLLILLTFILYETQCAPSILPLKILKSILDLKYPTPIVKLPTFETEIFPINNCEDDAKGDIIVELNPQFFENKDKPTIVEIENIDTNPHVIPVEVYEENSEANSKINDGANNEKDSGITTKIDVKENVKENPEENINVNSEEDNKAEKNPDPQIFSEGITSEVKPVVTDGDNHSQIQHSEMSIKEKIKAKIELIRSKLKSRRYPVEPVPEISTQDSTFLFEEDDNHDIFTTHQPSTTIEPTITIEPITTTLNPIVVGENTFSTEIPVNTVEHITTMKPVTTTESISHPPCVQVNNDNECDDLVITIPNNKHRPHKFYLSPTTYQLFFVNCPLPWAPERCYQPNHQYVPNPIYPNKLAVTPMNLANMEYYGPNYGTYKGSFGLANVMNFNNNNYEVDMNQPMHPSIMPGQNERSWVDSSIENTNPIVFPSYPTLSSTAQTEIRVQPVNSDSGVLYSTSTVQPIALSPDEIRVLLPVDRQRNLVKPEDQQRVLKMTPENQWTQYSGPVPDLINTQDNPQQKSRGDISYEPQDQGDEYTYPMKGRRHVESNDGGHLFVSNDNGRLSNPSEITPVETPVNELQTKDESTTAKTEKMVTVKSQSDIGNLAVE